jgi:hypothetical protein
MIRNRDINNKCKFDVYKVYFKKILLYEAESMTCTKKEESKIQAMEMKFLRGILGKTRRNKIRNDDISKQLKVDDINHDMKRNKLKWYGHVMSMADERIPKKMLEMKLTKRQAENQVDGSSKETYGKHRKEMYAGATRQGMGRQGQMEISL